MLQKTRHFIDALYQNVDPYTNSPLPPDSVFATDRVRHALNNLRSVLRESNNGKEAGKEITLSDRELDILCTDLRTAGFSITATQLTHILLGSRRVVDPLLRSISVFGKYRGVCSKIQLRRYCENYLQGHFIQGDDAKAGNPNRKPRPWKDEPFFKKDPFDQLDEQEYDRLGREIAELGLKRSGTKLPAFIARIRERLPRSYEPWSREERALLMEAMCYTNNGEKLGRLFGRGAKSVTEEGKRLIHLSRQRHAEQA
ncbi:hypothetical protein CEQ90_12125 [Lewinellaceae bacterium SD302]|nr:hypothetical protein CEQ90_12125 [Lewinellaceae bacterium SD302]